MHTKLREVVEFRYGKATNGSVSIMYRLIFLDLRIGLNSANNLKTNSITQLSQQFNYTKDRIASPSSRKQDKVSTAKGITNSKFWVYSVVKLNE